MNTPAWSCQHSSSARLPSPATAALVGSSGRRPHGRTMFRHPADSAVTRPHRYRTRRQLRSGPILRFERVRVIAP
jgi:hypothetical protein